MSPAGAAALLSRSSRTARARGGALLALIVGLWAPASGAQDWGSQPEDAWSPSQAQTYDSGPSTRRGFSARVGVGFTSGPDTFLINLEAPYAFDRWVSLGPMIQIGLEDDEKIVAPTANLSVRIPDLPGRAFDRLHPFLQLGVGFAWIEDEDRPGSNSATGFLVPFGVGIEYQVSEHFHVGSQMMFNFLPDSTLSQNFFYSWQMLGIRLAF